MRGMICLLFIASYISAADHPFVYLHPSPESVNISPEISILIRPSQAENLSDLKVIVKGEKSGLHEGMIKRIDGIIIFDLFSVLSFGEKVEVKLCSESLNNSEFRYSFYVSQNPVCDRNSIGYFLNIERERATGNKVLRNRTSIKQRVINGVSVPSDFPELLPSVNVPGIDKGKIFIANYFPPYYIMILENDGSPYFYKRIEYFAWEFRLQPTGILTRYAGTDTKFFVGLDSTYTVVDTFAAVNGYTTDGHELLFDRAGNYYLIALGNRIVDMSQIVPGGSTQATTLDFHIQHFNPEGELIFEWLSFEHFNIIDAMHIDLTGNYIDWIHMNSIAVDYDRNLVISSRSLCEVTKINSQTGNIIWRLGGQNNQFLLPVGDEGISWQHDARPIEGKPGNYLIFDNGNFKEPLHTRVVEFYLDTVSMTAEKIWEFRHNPDIYSSWMGCSQRLPNGNTLINYSLGYKPKACEVTTEGEIVYKADFVDYCHSYRTRRFKWESVAKKPYLVLELYPEKVTLIFNKFGDKELEQYIIFAGSEDQILTPLDTTDQTFCELTDLEDEQTWRFGIKALYADGTVSPLSNIESAYVDYLMPGENYIYNGDFSLGADDWTLFTDSSAIAEGDTLNGEFYLEITEAGNASEDIQLIQYDIPLIQGRHYKIEFDLRADINRIVEFLLQENSDQFTNYSQSGPVIAGTQMQHYTHEFTMEEPTDYNSRLTFRCGRNEADLYFDNISLIETCVSGTDPVSTPNIDFSLGQNYPNPFNPSTTLNYNIPSESLVSVIIYNLLGEKVKTLRNGIASPGSYSIRFDASDLASGIYICNMKADPLDGSRKFSDSKKMLLIK